MIINLLPNNNHPWCFYFTRIQPKIYETLLRREGSQRYCLLGRFSSNRNTGCICCNWWYIYHYFIECDFCLTFASCCKVSSRINSIYFFLSALWIAITQYSDNTISCSYMEVNQGSISLTLSLWQTQWNIIEDLNRGNISSIFSSISEANASELLESILRHLVWNFLEILKKMSPKYW